MDQQSTYYNELIVTYFAGEASEEEIVVLANWIKASNENLRIFEEYKQIWDTVEVDKINSNVNVDEEWNKISSKLVDTDNTTIIKNNNISSKSTPIYHLPIFSKMLRIAAVLMILAVSAGAIYYFLKQQQPENQHVVAQNTSIENQLPDGSMVTLNTGASIDYPEKFKKNKRLVKLQGEAYFNVTHDQSKPFVVTADDIQIEVLGTSFYINTQAANDKVEVVLTTGKIAIYRKDKPQEKMILESGEKAEFSKTDQKITKLENNNENYMAFKTKKMVFTDTPLSEIVCNLNKIYSTNILIKDKSIADCKITVTFNNQSLDAVLNVLKATVDLNILKSGKSIELSGNGCK